MRTLTAGQEIQRVQDGATLVWLVVGTFDEYGIATQVRYWSSSPVTLSGTAFEDSLAQDGLNLGTTTLKEEGGISSVSGFTVVVRDEEDESELSATHVVSNDEVVVYLLFWSGTETTADLIEIARGVVEKDSKSDTSWRLIVRDASKLDLRVMPFQTLDPTTYPWAWAHGAPIPECFGSLLQAGWNKNTPPYLAPAKFTDRWQKQVVATMHGGSSPAPYQWYAAAKSFALIGSYHNNGLTGIVDVDYPSSALPSRQMFIYPVRAATDNTVTDWRLAADGNALTSASMIVGDKLHVWVNGPSKLGQLYALTVAVYTAAAAGPEYRLTVRDNAAIIYGPTTFTTTSHSTALSVTTYAEWDLQLLNVEVEAVDAHGGTLAIQDILLTVGFYDSLAGVQQEPPIYLSQNGWRDLVASYADGAVVYLSGTTLRNPVDQVQAMMRGVNLMGLPVAKVNTASFAAARAYRTSWQFDWWFPPDAQQRDTFIDKMLYDSGLHLWKKNGQWRVAVRDKTRTPDHFFIGDYHSPVSGNALRPPWQYDFETRPADASMIYNEIQIRYCRHPATGEYQKAEIASGYYRLTSHCTTSSATGYLVDLTATFITNNVVAQSAAGPGERVYVFGDKTYEVLTVVSQTTLLVEALDGTGVSDNISRDYWLGPNFHGTAWLSQQAYKSVNALGGTRQRTFLDDGGYKTDFVQQEATAELMRDYFLDWYAVPRDRISFPLFHNGIKLEEGDVFLLEHASLFAHRKAVAITHLDEDVNDSEVGWLLPHLRVSRFEVGDYIYVQSAAGGEPECVKVTALSAATDEIIVARGQLGTRALEHFQDDDLHVITEKWLCTATRPPLPNDPVIRVEAELVPHTHRLFPGVVPAGYPLWASASLTQRFSSGWATNLNGRVVDTDRNSSISYVGASTGTY